MYMWILRKYAGTYITDTHIDMSTGMERIFIQRIRYGEPLHVSYPVSLTSLVIHSLY